MAAATCPDCGEEGSGSKFVTDDNGEFGDPAECPECGFEGTRADFA